MGLFCKLLLWAIMITLAVAGAEAHDAHDHPALATWAEQQQVMPAARPRFSCNQPPNSCSCCNGADIVRTKFRVAENDADAWDWLNPALNKWERVPDDIIHWGEPTPDKQAVMFVHAGRTRCFFPPQEGGG